MRTPTTEQQAVLDSTARIRIVRAAPGSGKTWLVAELIRSELQRWSRNGGGVAALSFTRVGGEEIRKTLGYDLGLPHFVGTIDSFLFRYVVRPFLQRAHPDQAPPRLIPADWSPGQWTKGPGGAVWTHRGRGAARAPVYNLFEVCFIDEDANGPVMACPRRFQKIAQVPSEDRTALLNAKRQAWQRLGWLSHADSALIASEFLVDRKHGAVIRSIVLRRFPLLIVDEIQDTGCFLGKCIHALLEEPQALAVLVGDPDQAIYEFNGARPDLFSRFQSIGGASTLPLASSRRCAAAVCDAAKHVKDSEGVVAPAQGKLGRAILVHYGNMVADIPRVVGAISRDQRDVRLKVISRRRTTVDALAGHYVETLQKLGCPPLNHIHRAVVAFRQGKNAAALVAARAALELAVFGHEGASDKILADSKIDSRAWKALAVRCLLRANSIVTTGTLFDWQTAAGGALDRELSAFGLEPVLNFVTGKIAPQKRPGWDKPVTAFVPQAGTAGPALFGVPVLTIHGVKGETHDVTVFVCPPTT